MNNSIPLIRIEVESMRQSMIHAFSEQLVNMDQQFRAAVDDACNPQKVQTILTEAANKYFKQAVEEQTREYFLYGPGRNFIAEKVREKLNDQQY